MKTNRVYLNTAIGVATLMMSGSFFTENVAADTVNEQNNAQAEAPSTLDKQNEPTANNEQSTSQTTSNENQLPKEHKDVIWEPAPPLTRAQDADGNLNDEGTVRPHAQKASESPKKHTHHVAIKKKATAHNYASVSKKPNYNYESPHNFSPDVKAESPVKNIKQSAVQSHYQILPQAGEKSDTKAAVGAAMVSLSLVGLLGLKKYKI